MNYFSCRAECYSDVVDFSEAFFIKFYKETNYFKTMALSMGEFAIELKGDFTEEQILDVLRDQRDSHVMIQTSRPVPMSNNDMVRDYNKC